MGTYTDILKIKQDKGLDFLLDILQVLAILNQERELDARSS